MDVSSSTNTHTSSTGVEALKKSIDVQERQALKILESANEQAKEAAAQKTGLGTHLNILA